MDINQLDHKALLVFDAVARHLNASLAANELGLSSSCISRQINSLRAIFEDVLFIRRAQGFVMTTKAEQALPMVREILSGYQALSCQTRFDPAQSHRQFTLVAYNEFTYAVAKVIRDTLLPQAPNMKFKIRNLTSDCYRNLENGEIDFAIVYEQFGGKKLLADLISPTGHLYLIAKENHPVFLQPLSFESLLNYRYFELDNFDDLSTPLICQYAQKRDCQVDVVGYTDNLADLSRHLLDTNALALTCNLFTLEFVRLIRPLRAVPLPQPVTQALLNEIQSERPVGNYLVYSSINQSPAHQWVKTQLRDALSAYWHQLLQARSSTDSFP